MLTKLPYSVLRTILRLLTVRDICQCCMVNRGWRKLIKNSLFCWIDFYQEIVMSCPWMDHELATSLQIYNQPDSTEAARCYLIQQMCKHICLSKTESNHMMHSVQIPTYRLPPYYPFSLRFPGPLSAENKLMAKELLDHTNCRLRSRLGVDFSIATVEFEDRSTGFGDDWGALLSFTKETKLRSVLSARFLEMEAFLETVIRHSLASFCLINVEQIMKAAVACEDGSYLENVRRQIQFLLGLLAENQTIAIVDGSCASDHLDGQKLLDRCVLLGLFGSENKVGSEENNWRLFSYDAAMNGQEFLTYVLGNIMRAD